jgi:hypothetical protein
MANCLHRHNANKLYLAEVATFLWAGRTLEQKLMKQRVLLGSEQALLLGFDPEVF